MALPSSGTISINQIRNILNTSNGSLRGLSSSAGFSTPDRMSDFYGYDPTPPASTLSYEVYAYLDGYGVMYYNGYNQYHYSSFNSTLINLDPPANQYLKATAVDSNGYGANVNLFINDAYVTSAVDSYSAYLDLYTSVGNEYRFEIFFGGA